LRTTNSSVWY